MILFLQAVRSVWRNKRAYLACIVLMAVGICMFVSFQQLFRNLDAARDTLYHRQRFGEGFAEVGGIPLSAVERLSAIAGIRQMDATIRTDARVEKPGSNRAITLRVSSFDPEAPERLNDFVLMEGAVPDENGILVSDVFAAANDLAVGDPIPIIVEGKRYTPVISGLVQSPEYVYAIPDTGQLLPDAETFGFGYMTVERLGTVSGREGTATNLSFLLEEGVTFRQMQYQLEESLEPYGLLTLYERKNQASHAMLDQEIESIGAMSTSLPMMFIFLAVIILYIMLKRIIEQERGQIGTLKAFGFSDSAILLHYMGYGAITGLAGGLAGDGLGLLMTDSVSSLYLEYFSLPSIKVPPDPLYLLQGLAVSLAAGLLGAFMGTKGILRLSPSEAMRPAAPPAVRSDWVGRIPLFRLLLTPYGYMAARNIARNKFRSGFVVVGVAFSFALTAFMASFGELFDLMMLNQFTKVELYDLKISLEQPAPFASALEEAEALVSVHRVEGMLELPVEVRHDHLKKSLSLTAIQPGSTLYQVYDSGADRTVPLPSGGVVISDRLAESLRVGRGDTLQMRTGITGDEDLALPVLEIIQSNMGTAIYISLYDLWELLGVPPTINGVILNGDDPAAIKDALVEADNVSAVIDQLDAMQIYTDMLETYSALISMMQVSGAVVAFAIITNTAAISLSERKREYATMRVLGMVPGEIGQVVGFEYWFLAGIAILPGILLTRLLKEAMGGMIDNDIFSMPTYTAPSSFLAAAALCLAAVALSNLLARRKIARFDMVEVLKERE